MKIGLYGGAFDPIHIGHMAVAEAAKKFGLDKVIFIPTGNMPHKKGCVATNDERLEMIRLAIENTSFYVSNYEMRRECISYSADTIEHFKSIYKNDDIYFIIGDDSYAYIDEWKDPERIFASSTVLVYPRDGVEILPPAVKLDCDIVDVSSSEIRKKIKSGENVSNLLKKEVYYYIIEHGLYQ
jgi:nicotinate-nucleotide adenylyltransferase